MRIGLLAFGTLGFAAIASAAAISCAIAGGGPNAAITWPSRSATGTLAKPDAAA